MKKITNLIVVMLCFCTLCMYGCEKNNQTSINGKDTQVTSSVSNNSKSGNSNLNNKNILVNAEKDNKPKINSNSVKINKKIIEKQDNAKKTSKVTNIKNTEDNKRTNSKQAALNKPLSNNKVVKKSIIKKVPAPVAVKKKIENEKNNKNEKIFTLIISRNVKGYTGQKAEILEKKQIKVEENKNAMTYLRDNFEMQENGGFIYNIIGINNLYPIPRSTMTEEQKQNKIMGIDWFIYLDGKKTPVGANDLYPKEGQELMFDIHEWDKREFQQ